MTTLTNTNTRLFVNFITAAVRIPDAAENKTANTIVISRLENIVVNSLKFVQFKSITMSIEIRAVKE